MLEAFSEASHAEWNDQLYLDPDVINGLALWLVDKQDPDTGAFQSVDDSYDIRMRVNRTTCGNKDRCGDYFNLCCVFSQTFEVTTVKN